MKAGRGQIRALGWCTWCVGVLAVLVLGGCAKAADRVTSPPDEARPTPAAPASAMAPPSAASALAAEPTAQLPPCQPLQVEPPPVLAEPIDVPVPPLVDPQARVLAPFYEKMARLVRGKADEPIRVGFYGDSNLTLDVISGTLRRVLQQRFGDAGHGYVGVGTPFRGYRHLDVRRLMVGHWETHLYSHHTRGEGFGAGGMAASTRERRAKAIFRTAPEDAPVGKTASRFGVFYLKQPKGGRFSITVDGEKRAVVDTEASAKTIGLETVEIEDGPHRFVVTNLEPKWIRLLGVTLEREVEGIVVDSFGVTGTTYFHLARMDEQISRGMLKLRPYDLVLFLIGTNFWRFEQNPQAAASVVRFHRQVRPGLPILIMSPPDHVRSKHSVHSDPRVVKIAEQLSEIARDNDCAFWDFRAAMGGDGSMRTFYYRGLAGKDLYHLTNQGAIYMGGRIAHALVKGLSGYLQRHPRAGCD